MTSVALKSCNPMTLAEMLEEAGITEYAEWSHEVIVTPNGNPSFKPRPYQISGLNHLAAHLPRCGLWDDPGVGKTLQLQAFALWMSGLGNKVVAVMLPGLVPQFLESFNNNFQRCEFHTSAAMLFGDKGPRQKQIDSFNAKGWPDLLVMSYDTFKGRDKAPLRTKLPAKVEEELNALPPEEALAKRQELASEIRREWEEKNKAYYWREGKPVTAENLSGKALEYLGYNLVICDEAHALKNPGSSIHQAVRDFVNPWDDSLSNGLILATGSPIKTNVEDAYGLISMLDPDRYGSMRAFDNIHCEMLPGTKFRKVVEYKNLDYLYAGLYAKGRRITKQQAFPDMPARQITEVSVDLSKAHKALYKKLVDEQVLELEDTLIDATQQQRMYQYVQQMLLCPEMFSDKPIADNTLLAALDELVEGIGDRKVIVFAWYQQSIDKLKAHYAKHNPVVINGAVTGNAREIAKRTFIDDPNCRMLLANPESGGVGLDGFQHVCSYAIFAEVYPHPGGFEQAIGRIERSGQTETVNIYLMVPKGTISVKLRNDLCRKESNANEAVRDKKTLIADMLGEEGIQGQII